MEAQLFTDQIGRDLRWRQFLNNQLGQLYQAIPFAALEKQFPVADQKGRPAHRHDFHRRCGASQSAGKRPDDPRFEFNGELAVL